MHHGTFLSLLVLAASVSSCTPVHPAPYAPPPRPAKVTWDTRRNPAATTPLESGVRRETDTRRYDDLNRRY